MLLAAREDLELVKQISQTTRLKPHHGERGPQKSHRDTLPEIKSIQLGTQGDYGALDNVNGYRSQRQQPQHTFFSCSGYFRRAKYTVQEWWYKYGIPLMVGAGVLAGIVGLIYLGYLDYMEGMCSLPKGTEMRTSTSVFPPSKDLSVILHVQEGIYGNILVKESDDWAQRNITIRMSTGSSRSFLDRIVHDVHLDPSAHTANVLVHMGTSDPRQTKHLLNNNCFRTNIEILYPRSSYSTGRLEVQVVYGEIALEFGGFLSRKPAAIFESLGLATMKGDVALRNVGVLKRTRIRTERGSVKGSLLTPTAVDVSTDSGNIDLKVHSTALEGRGPQYLDVILASTSGNINLKLSPSFNGHFDLTSTSSSPKITANTWVRYTTNMTNKITGWVSDNGWEPPYVLPRIDLYSTSQVTVAIEPNFLGKEDGWLDELLMLLSTVEEK
ncbi:hypothetical protein MVEG_10840 [Podila verticillata NRRL 6337]|nr:hypothetical protein MVEG_10840 [Podila verticillata NRRL 6337]